MRGKFIWLARRKQLFGETQFKKEWDYLERTQIILCRLIL